MSNEQINIPSLMVILVLSGLVIRYLFFAPGASSPERQQRDAAAHMRAREAAVERIQQMFPQVDRRTILWDLQRNGGNVAMTTERILSGRMETPPISYQPPAPPPSARSSTPTTATPVIPQPGTKPIDMALEPDLIARYNLQDKVNAASGAETERSIEGGKAWSANKDERQSLLQRRRDQMILEARRKMEAKLKAEQEAEAAGRTA